METPDEINLKNALAKYCSSTGDVDTRVAAFVEQISEGSQSGGALRNSRGRFLSTRNTRGRNRNSRGRFLRRTNKNRK